MATQQQTSMSEQQQQKLQQQQPVMSLLEKYSSIHRNIDQAREETAKDQQEILAAQRQLEALRQEHEVMKLNRLKAEKERQDLVKETDEALQKLVGLEHDYNQAASKRDQMKASLQATRQRAQEYRRMFLQRSRDFRSATKKLCTRAAAAAGQKDRAIVGTGCNSNAKDAHPITLLAYASALKPQHADWVSIFRDYDNALTAVEECEENDDEMIQAKKRLAEQTEKHLKAKQIRDELFAQKASLVDFETKQKSQTQKLEAQLARIRNDIEDAKSRQSLHQGGNNDSSNGGGSQQMRMTYVDSNQIQRMNAMGDKGNGDHRVVSKPKKVIVNPYLRSSRSKRSRSSEKRPPSQMSQSNREDNRSTATLDRRMVPSIPWVGSAQRHHRGTQKLTPTPASMVAGHRSMWNSSKRLVTPTPNVLQSQYPHRVGKPRASSRRDFGLSLRICDSGRQEHDEPLCDQHVATGVTDKEPAEHKASGCSIDLDSSDDDDLLFSFAPFGK